MKCGLCDSPIEFIGSGIHPKEGHWILAKCTACLGWWVRRNEGKYYLVSMIAEGESVLAEKVTQNTKFA